MEKKTETRANTQNSARHRGYPFPYSLIEINSLTKSQPINIKKPRYIHCCSPVWENISSICGLLISLFRILDCKARVDSLECMLHCYRMTDYWDLLNSATPADPAWQDNLTSCVLTLRLINFPNFWLKVMF